MRNNKASVTKVNINNYQTKWFEFDPSKIVDQDAVNDVANQNNSYNYEFGEIIGIKSIKDNYKIMITYAHGERIVTKEQQIQKTYNYGFFIFLFKSKNEPIEYHFVECSHLINYRDMILLFNKKMSIKWKWILCFVQH